MIQNYHDNNIFSNILVTRIDEQGFPSSRNAILNENIQT